LYRASLYDSSGPLLAAKQAEFFHGLQQAHPSFHFMSSRWFSRGRNSSHCGRSVSGDANPNGTSLYLRKSAHVSQAGLNKDASQAKNNITLPSILLKIMVSRAGLELAPTALKVQIGHFSVHQEMSFFSVV